MNTRRSFFKRLAAGAAALMGLGEEEPFSPGYYSGAVEKAEFISLDEVRDRHELMGKIRRVWMTREELQKRYPK